MAFLSLFFCATICTALSPLHALEDPPRAIYALLVAGSNGFSNYRHQADVAHAYHVLVQHGVPADNIVTMMYDDVAFDPKLGSICRIRLRCINLYRHSRNPNPGELRSTPEGPDYRKGMKVDYRFDSTILVLMGGLTASNASEDSYACNCAKSICYADQFSYKWMTNSEQNNLLDLAISQQYTEVKNEVKSSTVQMFGSNTLTRDPVGYFQGTTIGSPASLADESSPLPNAINIRDVPLLLLAMKVSEVEGTAEEAGIRAQLNSMVQKRERFGELFEGLMELLRGDTQRTDSAAAEQQDKCYEALALHFDQHCFPLRNNPFAFGLLKRFRPLCVSGSQSIWSRIMERMERYCTGNPVVLQLQGVE
ncbi:unnamed protein product [Heligmosomoides polygyrus]|uniref:Legumain n=1 Tax=Heligmosomoides polygyrus TaxID=6339 RepID=A0A183FFF4_HELPZ|nr:unnamed protein product [Heligmosomoides polygyrus]